MRLGPPIGMKVAFLTSIDSKRVMRDFRRSIMAYSAHPIFPIEHVAATQSLAVRLRQSASRVDQPRPRTSSARARITLRSACALRCFTGHSNSGSILASRARVCASSRSSFLRLSPISRTLRACATITSCPNPLSKPLIQGECVPVSNAIRLRGMAPKTSCNAFVLVRARYSSCIWPA